MKTSITNNITRIVFLSAMMFLPVLVFAQGGDPDTPIDGGLSLLLAAGAAYGVKKYRDGKKKQEEVEK